MLLKPGVGSASGSGPADPAAVIALSEAVAIIPASERPAAENRPYLSRKRCQRRIPAIKLRLSTQTLRRAHLSPLSMRLRMMNSASISSVKSIQIPSSVILSGQK